MAYNLKDLAKDAILGEVEYVSTEEKRQRLIKCNSCEHNKMQICKMCGCMVQMKATLKKASCPLGKW